MKKSTLSDRIVDRTIDVSVVIPCFNSRSTIAASIESALAQSFEAKEIVVVDDGSTDDSLAIIRKFEPNVRVITGVNRGVSAARNAGIELSRGEWLLFLDSDDFLEPGTLNERIALASTTSADVIVCDWQEISERHSQRECSTVKRVDMEPLAKEPDVACAVNIWLPTAAILYRRALVKTIGGFRTDLPVIQDARLLFDAAFHGARIVRSPHIGARYFVRAGSLSRRSPVAFWSDVLVNGKQIEALWRNRTANLSNNQRLALSQIYNGAAYALFRSCSPCFRNALAALREAGLPVDWRNQVADALANFIGQSAGASVANLWTKTRHFLAPGISV